MNKLKKILNTIKKKTGFYQGLALGLVITSTLSYAVVTLTTFTAGTPISSTDMNANFGAIKAKLDSLDVGMTGKLAGNFTVTCSTMTSMGMYPTDFITLPLAIDTTDGNYNTTSHVYTIPETAIYRIFYPTGSPAMSTEISIDGGTTWVQNFATTTKLTMGTQLRVISACGTMDGAAKLILATDFIFAIKKF